MNWETEIAGEEDPLDPWNPGTAALVLPIEPTGKGLGIGFSYPFTPVLRGSLG